MLLARGVWLLSATCSQTTVVLPSRDLDRPTDMTFACVHKFTHGRAGVRQRPAHGSLSSVRRSRSRSAPTPWIADATAGNRTYAFVPNSERGDLSVIDMSYCRPNDAACSPPGARLVDLDPAAIRIRSGTAGRAPRGHRRQPGWLSRRHRQSRLL